MMSEPQELVYLDANVLMSITDRWDESDQETLDSLDFLLSGAAGDLRPVTSAVTLKELRLHQGVSPEAVRKRRSQRLFYWAIEKVDQAADREPDGTSGLLGRTRFLRLGYVRMKPNALAEALSAVFPDAVDVHHLITAHRRACRWFVTDDRRTIIRPYSENREQIAALLPMLEICTLPELADMLRAREVPTNYVAS